MKLPRRRFLRLAAGAAALPAVSRIAGAQTYPSRPVRVIVPVAPAGTTDILARLIGQWLSEQLGQSFIVENRPGASTMIGTFKVMTGVDMVHVQYRGNAPALIDLLAGQVQVGFDTMPASIEYVRAGKLRALAVSTVTRSQTLPDLPTVSEFVPGYESSGYFGLGAPGKTPAEIIDKLNREVNAGLADPKLRAQLTDLGGMILAGSPADFRKLIDDETEKWGKVIRAANIKPD
jgi:tripartite-type tricarboxylate transporter receptor subunit TctC